MKKIFLILFLFIIIALVVLIMMKREKNNMKSSILNVFMKNDSEQSRKDVSKILDKMTNSELKDTYVFMKYVYEGKKSKIPNDLMDRISIISSKYGIFT